MSTSPPKELTLALLSELEALVWAGCPRTPAWTCQPLGVFPLQPKNGPCGVLSVYTAEVLAGVMLDQASRGGEICAGITIKQSASGTQTIGDIEAQFSVAAHVEALIRILSRCAPGPASATAGEDDDTLFRVCINANFAGENAVPDDAKKVEYFFRECRGVAALRNYLVQLENDATASFRTQPDGCLRLVYSAALTRGLDKIRSDADNEIYLMSEGLIAPPFGVCTSELMAMLGYSGKAQGNFALSPLGGNNECMALNFGILTSDSGFALASAYKNPRFPLFILHGGDHYTLLIGAVAADSAFHFCCAHKDAVFLHWNGLPPGGPRFCALELGNGVAVKPSKAEASGANENTDKYGFDEVKDLALVPGEAEEVVQADKNAGIADKIESWLFEVALKIKQEKKTEAATDGTGDDAHIVSEPTSDNPDLKGRDLVNNPIHVLEPGPHPPTNAKNIWRCRACYETRFVTMCFAQNDLVPTDGEGGIDPQKLICQHCSKPAAETGWTLWLTYNQLPRRVQKQMQLRYGPKIVGVLENRWNFEKVPTGAEKVKIIQENLVRDDDTSRKKLYWPSV